MYIETQRGLPDHGYIHSIIADTVSIAWIRKCMRWLIEQRV